MKTLYLIKCNEYLKIGICSNLEKRLSTLQVGCPYRLEVLKSYPLINAESIEKRLHRRFLTKNKRGEWFKFDRMLLPEINAFILEHGKLLRKQYPQLKISIAQKFTS